MDRLTVFHRGHFFYLAISTVIIGFKETNSVCHSPHYILPYMEMINQGDNMASVTPENIKATTNVH